MWGVESFQENQRLAAQAASRLTGFSSLFSSRICLDAIGASAVSMEKSMYIRTRFAAVCVAPEALASSPRSPVSQPCRTEPATGPMRILWADRALVIPAGRVTGVRHRNGIVEVALIPAGGTEIRWMLAERVLSQRQIERWLGTAAFRQG